MLTSLRQSPPSDHQRLQPAVGEHIATPAVSTVFASRDLLEIILHHAWGGDPGKQALAGGQAARFETWTRVRQVNQACRALAESPRGIGALLGKTPETAHLPHAALRAGKLRRNWIGGRSRTMSLAGSYSFSAVAFSADGRLLASGTGDGTLHLWNLSGTSPIPIAIPGRTDWITAVAVSPDGSRLASGSADGTVRLWDLSSTSPAFQALGAHTDWVTAVAFCPDGTRLAVGSGHHTVRLWHLSGASPSVNAVLARQAGKFHSLS